ncbi:hypothetical protein QR680_011132 [Steinernema hermaphroditum]|uniref:Uncharacterized protein n=1 Tax=Steinernema hermaphroditum TaxID=289476 RepID=A0AA39ITQ5_9BILA|nr:hypothetical protein QR680_011132 [Steinernema hermaphroditum]
MDFWATTTVAANNRPEVRELLPIPGSMTVECEMLVTLLQRSAATVMTRISTFVTFALICAYTNAQLRSRPRGLGIIKLPTGMTDERSSMFFPGLYIAGDKAALRPQTVPDIHLPGQAAHFTGKTAFNPFTHAVGATYTEDLVDSWGAGFAVNGVNNYLLDVRRNFDDYANMKYDRNDGSYQPFILGFAVGAEFDGLGTDKLPNVNGKDHPFKTFSPGKKIKELGGSVNIPILGVNEIFDLDGHFMTKGNGGGILNSHLDFPLTLADPHERFPASITYLNYMADRLMHYGHVVPNVNLFGMGRDKVMERLTQNKLNPTLVG